MLNGRSVKARRTSNGARPERGSDLPLEPQSGRPCSRAHVHDDDSTRSGKPTDQPEPRQWAAPEFSDRDAGHALRARTEGVDHLRQAARKIGESGRVDPHRETGLKSTIVERTLNTLAEVTEKIDAVPREQIEALEKNVDLARKRKLLLGDKETTPKDIGMELERAALGIDDPLRCAANISRTLRELFDHRLPFQFFVTLAEELKRNIYLVADAEEQADKRARAALRLAYRAAGFDEKTVVRQADAAFNFKRQKPAAVRGPKTNPPEAKKDPCASTRASGDATPGTSTGILSGKDAESYIEYLG